MKKNILHIFQIAFVFIGTIVGAGLASGKEITEFFSSYGLISFLGIFFCGGFYILIGSIICKISIKYKLNSYSEAIKIISPNLLGKFTGIITTIYLISSASIILAGSGALLHQFFNIPTILGSILMFFFASIFLLRGTNGLIEINSFIVPSLLFTITLISILYFLFCKDILSLSYIKQFTPPKTGIALSTLLYAGYNTLCCSGVLVPLSNETKNTKNMILGISLGALGLTFLSSFINILLLANQPYIYKYEIPLLLVSERFGNIIKALLLLIILLEMFSTEVSDVFSITKTLEQSFNMDFKRSIFLVLTIALFISRFGFSNLITTLYPMFGLLSLIFISQCALFYYKHYKELNS